MTASLAGRDVTIRPDPQSSPFSEASWLTIECRGFDTEDEARDFGEQLRCGVHVAGLCARVGVDANDTGENRMLSFFNPDVIRNIMGPDGRNVPDVHGIAVVPDDGRNLLLRMSPMEARLLSNVDQFIQALEESLPEDRTPVGNSASTRRAIRMLNLADMNTERIVTVVLAISAVEGLAADPGWTDDQKDLIVRAAEWLEESDGDREEVRRVVEAVRKIRHSSIRQRIRKLLDSNDLSHLWDDWDDLYSRRSKLIHGAVSLTRSEINALATDALMLCGKIVISTAKRKGIQVPGIADLHFNLA